MQSRCFALLCFLAMSVCLAYGGDLTLYRCQVGAYNSQEEADAKVQQVAGVIKDASITIGRIGNEYPFKVSIGHFSSYEDAKAFEKTYEASYGDAFIVSETATLEEAVQFGLKPPANMNSQVKELYTSAKGMSEQDLLYNAQVTTQQADALEDRNSRNTAIKSALPYLLEIAQSHPQSASAPWARLRLGNYYVQEYLIEFDRRMAASEKVGSATEQEAAGAALEQFTKIVDTYQNSSEAEDAAYQVASVRYFMTRYGNKKDAETRALKAYEDFLRKYPQSARAQRASVNLAGIKYEMAKNGWETFPNTYAAMENILASSDALGTYEKGRVLLMMAEINQYTYNDYTAALAVLEKIDLGPEQDRKTAADAVYVISQAHQAQGHYAEAASTLKRLVDTYNPQDFFDEQGMYPLALYQMGECLMKVKDWDGARDAFLRLKEEWPNDSRAPSYDAMLAWIENERTAQ